MWRQLRWRLVGAQMVVVLVGVLALASTAQLALRSVFPRVESALTTAAPGLDVSIVEQTAAAVSQTMQRAVLQSLLIAAGTAALAGLLTSLLLIRQILRPLSEIAASSQRIADGHYGERVAVPFSDELAKVATNFNQMAESLEQIESRRVQMIGNVAHELRTPLTGLRGYLEGLLDGLFPPNSATFAPMQHEVHRLQRLIDDLQALSRVEAGQFDLHLHHFDVVPVVKQIVSQMHPLALDQKLTLNIDSTSAALTVYADRDRVTQVLVNLLSNALRYTPDGGAIAVRIDQDQQVARIAVQDTGIGIPLEHQKHIFDRFYRVDPSRVRTSGGSGIGLTIARHLAWAMGGDLTVQSSGLGDGSVFTFTVPALRDQRG